MVHSFRGLYYGSYASPSKLVRCLLGHAINYGNSLYGIRITSVGVLLFMDRVSWRNTCRRSIVTLLWGGDLGSFFKPPHHLLPPIIAGASTPHPAALHGSIHWVSILP